MDRITKIVSQIKLNTDNNLINRINISSKKNSDDIMIVDCKRTALCRSRRGGFKDTLAVDLLVPVVKDVIKKINPAIVSDVVVGNVLAVGTHRHIECRMACFIAGLPETTCVRTVNRQCSSGLQAMADVASDIKAGYYDVGIAAGLESMTVDGKFMKQPFIVGNSAKKEKLARDALIPMGITSENIAKEFGITRIDQDQFSVQSHARATSAKEKFQEEIVHVKTIIKDLKTNKPKTIIVKHDDGVRSEVNLQSLSNLRPAFKKGGTTTAGNSSQVSDGAAAALMMKRSKCEELGLKSLGVFKYFTVSGVPPHIMGIGPAYAIPKVCEMAGCNLNDIDLFEINEAFASQATYCVNKLGLTMENVNVNGGALAIGHPLGCTGVRMAATLLYEMKRRRLNRGIVSMCIGTGMGAAAIFERD